jgi:hypothetical protein
MPSSVFFYVLIINPLMFKRSLLLLLVMVLTACSNEGVSQQTLVAFEAELDQRREVIGATSTAEIELLLLTLDYSYIELTRTQSQQNNMNIILATRDISVDVPTQAPTLTPPPIETVVPVDINNQAPIADVIVTPFMTPTIEVILPSPTPTPNEALPTLPPNNNLRNVVLSRSVGADDCADSITQSFTTTDERIYIVSRAFDVMPNTEIASVWRRGGEELTRFTFVPTFPVNDACIWFYADPTDFDFIAGAYDVTLQLNGQDAISPIPFNVIDEQSVIESES